MKGTSFENWIVLRFPPELPKNSFTETALEVLVILLINVEVWSDFENVYVPNKFHKRSNDTFTVCVESLCFTELFQQYLVVLVSHIVISQIYNARSPPASHC